MKLWRWTKVLEVEAQDKAEAGAIVRRIIRCEPEEGDFEQVRRNEEEFYEIQGRG